MQDFCLPAVIDHTLLKPEAVSIQIKGLCREALEFSFGAVCVLPTWVKLAVELLKNSTVQVCTVVGFPLGGNTSVVKAFEAAQAVADGAREIDMVINLGALKGGEDELVIQDIRAVVEAARKFQPSGLSELNGSAGAGAGSSLNSNKPGVLVKVILETALLNDEEKIRACQLAREAGADMVKTSTGFGPRGATVEDIRLMRKVVGPTMGIKASGGIRSLDAARALLEAGATRLGTSAGVSLVQEWQATTTD